MYFFHCSPRGIDIVLLTYLDAPLEIIYKMGSLFFLCLIGLKKVPKGITLGYLGKLHPQLRKKSQIELQIYYKV